MQGCTGLSPNGTSSSKCLTNDPFVTADTTSVSFSGLLRIPILLLVFAVAAIAYPAAAAAIPPVVGITSPAFNAKLNTAQVPVHFNVSDGDGGEIVSVSCAVDGGGAEPCTSPWTTPELSEGIHFVTVEAEDDALETGSSSVVFTIDLTLPPTTLSSSGLPAARTTSTNAAFTFSSADATATFQCRIDAESFAPCTSPMAYAGLLDGAHSFEVRAIDPSGNVDATPASHDWEIDLDGPAIAITGHPAANKTFGTFVFSVDETAVSVQCRLNAGAFTACVPPVEVAGLQDQQINNFRVRATDELGNVSEELYSWLVDTVAPPVPTIAQPSSGSWLNDSTPEISGAINEANAGVRVYSGTVALGTAVTTGNSWTFTPTTPLADGSYSIRTRGFDAAGNFSGFSPVTTLQIDTEAPDTPTLVADTPTNDSTPSVGGVTEQFAVVEVFADGSPVGESAPAGAGGDWSTALDALADGSYELTAVATDRAGNASAVSVAAMIEIDTVAPAAPTIVSPVDGSLFPDATVEFLGTGDAGSEITILRGAVPVATTTVDGNGDWMTTVDETEQGVLQYSAVASDAAGNDSAASDVVEVTVDTSPPTLSFEQSPPQFSNSQDASFEIVADEANVDFECSLDEADWEPCAATLSFVGLAPGAHTLRARGTDFGGLTGEIAEHAWTIDIEAPAAPTIASPLEGAVSTDATPTITGSAEAFADVEVLVGTEVVATTEAEADGDWAATPSTALEQGATTIHAVASDAAGNESATSPDRSFTIDSIAPDTAIGTAPPALTNQSAAQFSFTADDPGATFECRVDGGDWLACSSPRNVNVSGGSHQFEVRATDVHGNVESTPANHPWVVDIVAPVGGSSEIVGSRGSDGIPAFTIASDDPSATATCRVDAGTFAACATPFKPNSLSAGQHMLVVRHIDTAGNSSDQSIAFAVTPAVPPQPSPYEDPPAPPTCPSAKGIEIRGVSLKLSKGRQIVAFRAAPGVARVAIVKAGRRLVGADVVTAARNRVVLRRRNAGPGAVLQIETVSRTGIRATSTAQLAESGSGYRLAAGAVPTHETRCTSVGASGAKVRLKGSRATTGARTLRTTLRSNVPAIVAISSPTIPGWMSSAIVPKGSKKLTLRFGAPLKSGSHRLTIRTITVAGDSSSTLGTLRVR